MASPKKSVVKQPAKITVFHDGPDEGDEDGAIVSRLEAMGCTLTEKRRDATTKKRALEFFVPITIKFNSVRAQARGLGYEV